MVHFCFLWSSCITRLQKDGFRLHATSKGRDSVTMPTTASLAALPSDQSQVPEKVPIDWLFGDISAINQLFTRAIALRVIFYLLIDNFQFGGHLKTRGRI